MRKLCLGLSIATMVLLVACGGDSGSSANDIGESSGSGEIDVIESCASDESLPSSSEVADSNTSEESSSSEQEDLDSSNSEDSSSSESSSNGKDESSCSEGSSSSSEEESSSSILLYSSDASIYDPTASTLTDLRDGQVYRTITIDIPAKDYSEVWMAENLNYETENSYCYEEAPANCSKYGRLYTWAAAVVKPEDECGSGFKCDLGSGDIRGVCPKGWHLPSRAEWETLIVAVDGSIVEYDSDNIAGSKLKSSSGWYDSGNGTDNFGFLALPAGYRGNYGGYYYESSNAYFWSSIEYNSSNAYRMNLNYRNGNAYLGNSNKSYGFSVRCLKD